VLISQRFAALKQQRATGGREFHVVQTFGFRHGQRTPDFTKRGEERTLLKRQFNCRIMGYAAKGEQ
jgi:hypothetical protein